MGFFFYIFLSKKYPSKYNISSQCRKNIFLNISYRNRETMRKIKFCILIYRDSLIKQKEYLICTLFWNSKNVKYNGLNDIHISLYFETPCMM